MWILFFLPVIQAQPLINLVHGFLHTAGTNLARLNPCPHRERYKPRSSYDIACLTYDQPVATTPHTHTSFIITDTGVNLPQSVSAAPIVRDTKDTGTTGRKNLPETDIIIGSNIPLQPVTGAPPPPPR